MQKSYFWIINNVEWETLSLTLERRQQNWVKRLDEAISSESFDHTERFWVEAGDFQDSGLTVIALRVDEVGRRTSHVDNHEPVWKNHEKLIN